MFSGVANFSQFSVKLMSKNHITWKFDGLVYNLSFFNPNIYNICVGVYLSASTLQYRLMWRVCDRLLLLHLFGLVLLWLYMAGINSTIPVDYYCPKKSFLNMQGQLVFLTPSYTIYHYH